MIKNKYIFSCIGSYFAAHKIFDLCCGIGDLLVVACKISHDMWNLLI